VAGTPSTKGRATKVSKVGRDWPIMEYQTRTATLNSIRCLRGSHGGHAKDAKKQQACGSIKSDQDHLQKPEKYIGTTL